jgi:transposase
LCFEYGLIIAKGKSSLCKTVSSLLEPECCELPAIIKNIMESLWSQYLELGRQFKTLSTQFKQLAEQSDSCQRLMKIEGIGPVGAVGLISSLGDGRHFKNGRHASVYIGATPKQHSSGGKAVMIGINKHGGDKALRSILYQGALAVISRLPDVATTHKQQWLINLVKRAGIKRACVALINKNIRTAWALLAHQTEYKVHTLNV